MATSPRVLTRSLLWLLLLTLCLPSLAEAAQKEPAAKKKEKAPKFIRVNRDDRGDPTAMETAVVSYVPADGKNKGLVVDLIGAVHVGDKSYYDELNKLFESYDVLLYELVAPEGTRIPKGGAREGGGNPVSALQSGMKTMLDLEFQLERVDYTKNNFVHADMSPEEFAKSMKDRGESFLQIFFRMMGQAAAQQAKSNGKNSDVAILFALFSKDRAYRLKKIMAEQFEDLEGAMVAFNGPDGSTLITERNKKALAVLSEQIKAGKKRIGIFYGAGHLPDMDDQLAKEFGMKRSKFRWVKAWDLTLPKKDQPRGDRRNRKQDK